MTRDARSLLRNSERVRIGGSFPSGPGKRSRGPKPPHGLPRYPFPHMSRTIDTNSTAITIVSSTTETVLIDVDAPALTIQNRGATKLTAAGTVTNTAAAGGTVTYRVKIDDGGGDVTVLATSGIVCSTDVDSRAWNLDTMMFSVGTGVQAHWGTIEVSSPSAGNMPPVDTSVVGYSTSGEDETAAINMTVTAQLSAAAAGFSVVMESAVFEAIT